jgi:hypothetical protein
MMEMIKDAGSLGVIALMVLQFIALVTWGVRTGDGARRASKEAIDAKAIALEAHDKLAAQSQAFSLWRETNLREWADYRERIAREYVAGGAMTEMKRELLAEIHDVRDRVDQLIGRSKMHV